MLDQRLIERIQPAEQGPAEHDRCAERHFDQPEAALGDGVVGGALVCFERDAFGKIGGHLLAVLRDMAHLARGKPQSQGQTGEQKESEQRGPEQGRRHVLQSGNFGGEERKCR